MANWCWNHIQFEGDEGQIDRVFKVFDKMVEVQKRTGYAQKFTLIEKNEDLLYLFEIDTSSQEEGILTCTTKWSPCAKHFAIIAQMFGLSFTYSYDELSCGIYGQFTYDSKENVIYDQHLEEHDFIECLNCGNGDHPDACDGKQDDCESENDYEKMDRILDLKQKNAYHIQIRDLE